MLGKDYKELGSEYADPKLKELASDAKFVRDFQSAYAEAHQAMSARVVGLFGKNIAGFRAIEELNNKIKSDKSLKEESRRNSIERVYGKLEEGGNW